MNTIAKLAAQSTSPDENAAGFVEGTLNPLRYQGHSLDPYEAAGMVVSMVPPGARVLDVGCGNGEVAELVRDSCRAEVIGIEPDVDRAARTRDRGLLVHQTCLTRELIQSIGPFDVVLLADVLEHLPNPQSMLLLCREALKPGATVIVSVPNIAHWSVRINLFFRGKFKYEASGIMDATHLRWFTAGTIKSLVSSSGFEVIDYRATAGTTALDNVCRRPVSWLPTTMRTSFLRFTSRTWPSLFGCQHVLAARRL